MPQYDYSEVYNGKTITGEGTPRAGSTSSGGNVVTTHAFTWKIDDDIALEDNTVTDATLSEHLARAVRLLKDQIDNLQYADKILLEFGFEVSNTVHTPTGFSVTQPGGAGTNLLLYWDVVGPVELYTIQKGTASDYSDASTISTGDTSPYPIPAPAPGTWYFRIKAGITGMTDSDWATASVEVE